jgi:hypothetical protein
MNQHLLGKMRQIGVANLGNSLGYYLQLAP